MRPPSNELNVSDFNTVYHEKLGVLCQGEVHWDFILYHPVVFKDKAAAYRWVRDGSIADIQEGLTNLRVAFSRTTIQQRHKPECEREAALSGGVGA